jgi:group II intron reverse transcriptase/maturase
MSTTLAKITLKAKTDPKLRFTSLAHLLTPEYLKENWRQMNKAAAKGIDGETIKQFGNNLEERIEDIVAKLKSGNYRAPFIRRVDIPKGKGKTRPLGITTVEDRLVQRAVAGILSAIFEQDFLEISYGYRPGRSAHDALRSLRSQIIAGKVRYVYEADIRGYFSAINHDWIRKMVRQRIADKTILKLIDKWLKAGVMFEGRLTHPDSGAPQGGPISCILSNLYLHYVLDLWFEKVFKSTIQGEAYITRFVDDFVCCFQNKEDAAKFDLELKVRMKKFDLELAEDKTRMLQFGRFARPDLTKGGLKPEIFVFLGFEHICGIDENGKFALVRIPSKKSCRRFLDRTNEWLKKHIHWRRADQRSQLTVMLNGFYQYFGLTHCKSKLDDIHYEVKRQWRRAIKRQSQRHYVFWSYLNSKSWFSLPYAKKGLHPTV